ncbi:hypothetical protein D9758_016653 [Tetrapyrgos nigripes]|uniref:HD/PDEase domain-containing protein n=1 Tax=Tetrapyrgos nigripes TaxID=182062 RepID=A0A8H5FLK8_9AGAR|nr:hypothetical protein D9758_016653 [Tetrapyrgos nigripes]
MMIKSFVAIFAVFVATVAANTHVIRLVNNTTSTLPKTFDAFVPSNISEFLARATDPQPRFVPLTELRNPGIENAYKPSSDLAKKLETEPILDHSIRMYYFSLLMLHSGFPSDTPGVPQITREELLKRVFLTCILHDVGLSNDDFVLNHPAHAMSFELQGGILAYEHLLETYPSKLNADEVGDIAQGIMLHTLNPTFTSGAASAANFLVAQSALFDLGGYGSLSPDFAKLFGALLSRDSVGEIEAAYPHGAVISEEFVTDIEGMLKQKPNCLLSHAPPNLLEVIGSVINLADS